ncbi:hypothetical protein OIU76_023386 [Salix suchowensis]|nr:hypothetical protein OIU76_023386 [Salix suchowensis]
MENAPSTTTTIALPNFFHMNPNFKIIVLKYIYPPTITKKEKQDKQLCKRA